MSDDTREFVTRMNGAAAETENAENAGKFIGTFNFIRSLTLFLEVLIIAIFFKYSNRTGIHPHDIICHVD
jgi:hypothetical protein